jgi:hypothetical protein
MEGTAQGASREMVPLNGEVSPILDNQSYEGLGAELPVPY